MLDLGHQLLHFLIGVDARWAAKERSDADQRVRKLRHGKREIRQLHRLAWPPVSKGTKEILAFSDAGAYQNLGFMFAQQCPEKCATVGDAPAAVVVKCFKPRGSLYCLGPGQGLAVAKSGPAGD